MVLEEEQFKKIVSALLKVKPKKKTKRKGRKKKLRRGKTV